MPPDAVPTVYSKRKIAVQCGEIGKWCCMYSKNNPKKDVAMKLIRFNGEFVSSCGTILQDTVLYDEYCNGNITNDFVKGNVTCTTPVRAMIHITFIADVRTTKMAIPW